jgi:excisionase family DNA binding protein
MKVHRRKYCAQHLEESVGITKAKSSAKKMDDNDLNSVPRLALSVQDACKSINISRAKLYELMKAGQLGFTLIGSRRIVPVSELEALLARGSKGR